MSKSLFSRYRVDDIPLIIRPIFYLFGYGLGALLFTVLLILRIATKVEITGQDNLKRHLNHIFCCWHSFVPLALLNPFSTIKIKIGNPVQITSDNFDEAYSRISEELG